MAHEQQKPIIGPLTAEKKSEAVKKKYQMQQDNALKKNTRITRSGALALS